MLQGAILHYLRNCVFVVLFPLIALVKLWRWRDHHLLVRPDTTTLLVPDGLSWPKRGRILS